MEEEGLDITASAFREGVFVLEINNGGGYSYYGSGGLLIDEYDNIYNASRGIVCGKGEGNGKGSDEWRHYLSHGWSSGCC
jgi:hypothetical protein